jgi:hypothetical protein
LRRFAYIKPFDEALFADAAKILFLQALYS